MLSSGNTSSHYSAIVKRSSFQCKSAQLSVIKNVESPSCLTAAKTSCRHVFQYAGVPLIVFIKRSFPTNDCTVSAKLYDNIPLVTIPVQIFLSAILTSLFNFSCCVTDNA